jgi:hypothetical protein
MCVCVCACACVWYYVRLDHSVCVCWVWARRWHGQGVLFVCVFVCVSAYLGRCGRRPMMAGRRASGHTQGERRKE